MSIPDLAAMQPSPVGAPDPDSIRLSGERQPASGHSSHMMARGPVLLTFDVDVLLPGARLRPWRPADAPALQHALEASEAHLRAWTPWVIDGRVPGQSLRARLAAHASAFANGTEWVYGLFAPDDATVLGGCGLYPRIGPGALELGYWLAAHATGRGLATAASSALTRLAFAAPAIERVEIRCDPRNVASARVPARLGFMVDERASAATDGLQVWVLTRGDDGSTTGAAPRSP